MLRNAAIARDAPETVAGDVELGDVRGGREYFSISVVFLRGSDDRRAREVPARALAHRGDGSSHATRAHGRSSTAAQSLQF